MKKELIEFIDELHHNRDYYSRSKLLELIKEKINSLAQDETPSVSDNEDKRKNCRGYDKECNERFKDGFDCRNCFYY